MMHELYVMHDVRRIPWRRYCSCVPLVRLASRQGEYSRLTRSYLTICTHRWMNAKPLQTSGYRLLPLIPQTLSVCPFLNLSFCVCDVRAHRPRPPCLTVGSARVFAFSPDTSPRCENRVFL